MISSVIAKLSGDRDSLNRVLARIAAHSAVEAGELIDHRMLPITIETDDNLGMEETTRWLQSLDGVDFVDVVYVHLTSDDSADVVHSRQPREQSDRLPKYLKENP